MCLHDNASIYGATHALKFLKVGTCYRGCGCSSDNGVELSELWLVSCLEMLTGDSCISAGRPSLPSLLLLLQGAAWPSDVLHPELLHSKSWMWSTEHRQGWDLCKWTEAAAICCCQRFLPVSRVQLLSPNIHHQKSLPPRSNPPPEIKAAPASLCAFCSKQAVTQRKWSLILLPSVLCLLSLLISCSVLWFLTQGNKNLFTNFHTLEMSSQFQIV